MMSFEEFKKNVEREIKNYLPEDFADAEVRMENVVKVNDETLCGMSVRKEDCIVSPVIYLNGAYVRYTKGEDIETLMSELAKAISDNYEADFDLSFLGTDTIPKEKILCKVVNRGLNEEYAKDKICSDFLDLLVLYYIAVKTSKLTGTICITKKMAEKYGLSKEEIHEAAMNNLACQKATFRASREVIAEMMGISDIAGAQLNGSIDYSKEIMFILTNPEMTYGASTVLNDQTLKNIEKEIGSFYMLPSSVHEWIILRGESLPVEQLKEMVVGVNEREVEPQDKLSDNVYIYKDGKLSIASSECSAEVAS